MDIRRTCNVLRSLQDGNGELHLNAATATDIIKLSELDALELGAAMACITELRSMIEELTKVLETPTCKSDAE